MNSARENISGHERIVLSFVMFVLCCGRIPDDYVLVWLFNKRIEHFLFTECIFDLKYDVMPQHKYDVEEIYSEYV